MATRLLPGEMLVFVYRHDRNTHDDETAAWLTTADQVEFGGPFASEEKPYILSVAQANESHLTAYAAAKSTSRISRISIRRFMRFLRAMATSGGLNVPLTSILLSFLSITWLWIASLQIKTR